MTQPPSVSIEGLNLGGLQLGTNHGPLNAVLNNVNVAAGS